MSDLFDFTTIVHLHLWGWRLIQLYLIVNCVLWARRAIVLVRQYRRIK
jgi:hypothetical protein